MKKDKESFLDLVKGYIAIFIMLYLGPLIAINTAILIIMWILSL